MKQTIYLVSLFGFVASFPLNSTENDSCVTEKPLTFHTSCKTARALVQTDDENFAMEIRSRLDPSETVPMTINVGGCVFSFHMIGPNRAFLLKDEFHELLSLNDNKSFSFTITPTGIVYSKGVLSCPVTYKTYGTHFVTQIQLDTAVLTPNMDLVFPEAVIHRPELTTTVAPQDISTDQFESGMPAEDKRIGYKTILAVGGFIVLIAVIVLLTLKCKDRNRCKFGASNSTEMTTKKSGETDEREPFQNTTNKV